LFHLLFLFIFPIFILYWSAAELRLSNIPLLTELFTCMIVTRNK
jgi:hypothetical protein